MSNNDHFTAASRFASALDRNDFTRARLYLAPDCCYQTGREQLVGPDAILASYRENAEWASRALDQVIYESKIEEADGALSVLYLDRITHAGLVHEYRCRQHLAFNAAGQIVRIVHEELLDERAGLDEFLNRCGVRRQE